MKATLTLYLFFVFVFVQAQKDTLFYTYNNLPVSSFKECRTYGVLEYKSPDSVQVIETKFRKDGDVLSRTFYIDFKNQVKHGQQMFWNKGMILAVTKDYFKDTLQGYVKYYSDVGVLERERAYIDGVLVNDTAFVEINEKEFERKNLAEYMPIFPGCEGILDDKERQRCSVHALYGAIVSTVMYPAEARNQGIQGTVAIKFIINNKGLLKEVEVLKGIANGEILNQEAIRSVLNIPELIPGTLRGEEVQVDYYVPVGFRLNGGRGRRHVGVVSPFSNLEWRDEETKALGADRRPLWAGCHLKGTKTIEEDCTEWRISRFIKKNVIYPESLKKSKASGIIIVNFEVTEEGEVGEVFAFNYEYQAMYPEMKEEAIRVVKSIPKFTPAKKNGKPVAFQLRAVVKFKY